MDMELSTNLSAVFQTDIQPEPQDQMKLDALNRHAEEITEILQPVFRTLVIEMLELKRTGGGNA